MEGELPVEESGDTWSEGAIQTLKRGAPDLSGEVVHGYLEVTFPPKDLLSVALLARDELDFDYLASVTAVDWQDRFELVYHLYSTRHPYALVLKTDAPRVVEPVIESLVGLWPGANFQEREVYDLMGVRFAGHPDMTRILLSDDFPGHPLRKDFKIEPEYVLMRHLRETRE